jgi:hypothetical protein
MKTKKMTITKQKNGLGSVPQGLSWIKELSTRPTKKSEKKVVKAAQAPEPVKLTPVQHDVQEAELISSQKGLPKGWTRATFILKQEQLEQLKRAAYWERMTIKELITEALHIYLCDQDFQPIPQRRGLSRLARRIELAN